MANKKKTTSPTLIQKFLAYAASKEDKCILSMPVSETESCEFEVKSLLNAGDMDSFVSGVTDALFLNGYYTPALYSLVYAKAILVYYTNLKDSISNEDLIVLVFKTNIISFIESKINKSQKEAIVDAINQSIEFKKQEILSTQAARLEESIQQIKLLTDLTSKIVNQFNDIDMKQATEAVIKIANIPERDLVNNIFDVKFGEETSTKNMDTFNS